MRLRIPPGRAGRLWLRERLASARKAADLLDHKRRELEVELRRLRTVAAGRAEAWRKAAEDARAWLDRMDAAGGTGSIALAASLLEGPADVRLEWQQVMGVRYATDQTITFPTPPPASLLEGGAAVGPALAAHREAVDAAVAQAVADAAVTRIQKDIDRTVRRLRALQLRALPAHEEALARLELALDEKDREDGVAARWAAESGDAPARAGGHP